MPHGKQSARRSQVGLEAHKRRLDLLLVERGLCPSRSQAQREIRAGNVLVDGVPVDKPGALVPEGAKIELRERARYVSRGGLKLEGALRAFKIDVRGKTAIDIGASTGGFTDCLLQHGARKVYAVDVGYGQLDWRLRQDGRVIVLERMNARYLKLADIGERVDLATIDVSFISLKKILPPLLAIVKEGGDLVPLVKSQFEAGKAKVRRGVVRDPEVHLEVLEGLSHFVQEELGISLLDVTFSPIRGPKGNIEFFFHLRNAPGASGPIDLPWVVQEAHAHFGR
ncbi:MAG: TlyA family RNA methyltransferase [Candidatus Bipolaricaulia bacterium]